MSSKSRPNRVRTRVLQRENVVVEGLKELGDTLNLLATEVAQRAILRGGTKGIEVFRREIRRRAPVRQMTWKTGFGKTGKGKEDRQPGNLKKSIGRWFVRGRYGSGHINGNQQWSRQLYVGNPNESVSWLTGPNARAYYGRFVEKGRRAHEVGEYTTKGGRKGLLEKRQRTRRVGVMSPRPFMKPAFDAGKAEALRVFGEEVWKEIQRST